MRFSTVLSSLSLSISVPHVPCKHPVSVIHVPCKHPVSVIHVPCKHRISVIRIPTLWRPHMDQGVFRAHAVMEVRIILCTAYSKLIQTETEFRHAPEYLKRDQRRDVEETMEIFPMHSPRYSRRACSTSRNVSR